MKTKNWKSSRRKPPSSVRPKTRSAAPPAKLVTMPDRGPGVKADINVRFASQGEYERVKKAAGKRAVSVNRFIVEAALDHVNRNLVQAARDAAG